MPATVLHDTFVLERTYPVAPARVFGCVASDVSDERGCTFRGRSDARPRSRRWSWRTAKE